MAFAGALPLAWGIIRVVTASLVSPRGPARFPSVTPDAGVIAATALLTMGIGFAMRAFISSSEWVDGALVQERFTAALATVAAALTVLLSCMGVYGLLAYSVTARKWEIGVRVALGATRGNVVRMIVRDGLAIGVPGVLIFAPCAWAAAQLVRAQLYGIGPGDPRTLLFGAAMLLATALAASLLPALRASRVAPVEALRAE